MGVRKIVYLAEPNVSAKVLRATHGGGGCCAVWCSATIPRDSRAMIAGFDGSGGASSNIEALVNSKMAQALVPGASYINHSGVSESHPQHTYLIPFEDLPADQVAVLLRLLKLWSFGTYERAFHDVKIAFPRMKPEDAAVVAVYLSTGNPYDDGYTTFYANKGIEGGSLSSSTVKHGQNRMGGLLKLLAGEINSGVQKPFKISGYVKAGNTTLYNKGGRLQDAHWTVCHPVCIRSDQGPTIECRGYSVNLSILKKWVAEEKIDLVGASGKAQEPQPEEAPLSLGDAVASAPTTPTVVPKQARDSSGRFISKSPAVLSSQPSLPPSSTSSSDRQLSAPSRIPSHYSEFHKEQLRANRRMYVAGTYDQAEYRRIINQVKSHYQ